MPNKDHLMAESRKAKLSTEVDSSGAKKGFDEIKQGAQEMAREVTQAGQQAGAGLAKVGDGAKGVGDAWTREEGRMRAAVQRSTLELQTLGKSLSQKFEARIDLKGLDASKFAPYIASLKEAEEAQARFAASQRADTFVANLHQQAEAIGKTRSQLLELQAAQLGVADKVAPYIAKIREAEQGNQKFGASNKLAAFQTQQLGFQLHDFAVQIASGQNPLTAFVQQGSQLSGTFGGAGNALRAVLSLLTPFRLGMIAAAAGVGVLVAELVHAESGLRDLNTLQAQFAGTGRGEQFSNAFLKDYIRELSLAPGVTREVAGQIVSELAKVRDIGGAMFTDLGKLAVNYAKVTRTEVPAAASTLAKAFSDPAKGAKTLEEALGTLTSSQSIAIERLTRQGDIAGAQRVLFDALSASIKGLADDAMTPLQKSANDLGNAWDRAMDRMDQSQGLRTVNALLAKTVGSVQFLLDNSDKLGGLFNFGAIAVPGAAPAGVGGAIGTLIRSLISSTPPQNPTASGKVTDLPGAGPASPGGVAPSDAEIKRALEAANAYQSEAGKIAELTDKRTAFNKALTQSIALYGRDSEQSKRLRDAIAGINEQITNLHKRGGRDEQSVLDAQLQGRVKAAQDGLTREREAIAFQQRFLAGQYQAGEMSIVQFYDRKRDAIASGVAAEIAELEKERAAVETHLAQTTDPGKRQRDRERLGEIGRRQEDLNTQADRDTQLANQEQLASYKQLADQVANYRAELLQLQGDEAGAARVRAQQALIQAAATAKQTAGTPFAISQADLERQRVALEQTLRLNAARNATGIVNQALELEEGRIADAQRRGAITSVEAMSQAGEARQRAVAQLEEIVKAQEEVARSRPQDYQLQIDTAGARQQLERLKDELDPLAEQFRGLFTDATGDLFANLADDPKNAKESVKKWLTGITRELNDQIGHDLSAAIFGKDGPLGKLPGALGDLFRKGGKQGDKPLLDTSGVTQGLTQFQTTGLEPATSALAQFTTALQRAAGAVGGKPTGEEAPGLTTGDFARLDRGQEQAQALDEDAAAAAKDLTTNTTTAANAALRLADSAARGGSALSMLPQIIAFIQAAAGGGSAGSGIGGFIASLFSSGGGGVNFGQSYGAGSLGTDLALFYAKGGYTGNGDRDKVAGIVHGREFVFDAEATAKIGRDTLERMHKAARRDPVDVAAELIARVRGKREFGGPVAPGGMYEVNERRPEVLTMGDRDYLMMGAKQGTVKPAGTGAVHIVNNTQGRIDRVEERQTSDGDRVLVLEQAMVAWLNNPNSKVSRTLGRTTTASRRR